MNEKLYLDHIDIMNLFKCGRDKARGIIRAVKMVSDIAGISGKVTTTDFEKWFNSPKKEDDAPLINTSSSGVKML